MLDAENSEISFDGHDMNFYTYRRDMYKKPEILYMSARSTTPHALRSINDHLRRHWCPN